MEPWFTEWIVSLSAMEYLELAVIVLLAVFVCIVAGLNGTGRYIAVYLPISIAFLVAAVFSEIFFTRGTYALEVYFLFEVAFSLFSLLLFPAEVRRMFFRKEKKAAPEFVRTERSQAEVEACIAGIIKALQDMSKNDIGALIVLSNGNIPKQVLDSGVTLNAEISSQLLEGIFFPKAPLHDGAVILSGHKIRAAGCFLPLTQSLNYPKELGTRHRAGIGITEVANVTVLIVSEETGIISIVKQGKIERYADSERLRQTLEEYYWKDLSVEHKR